MDHFILNHESRRELFTDENLLYKVEWNKSLMEGIIAPAYCTLLCSLSENIQRIDSYDERKIHLSWYFDLFPNVDKITMPFLKDMAKEIYKSLVRKQMRVLPVRGVGGSVHWASPGGEIDRKIYFDNLEEQLPEPPSISSSMKTRNISLKSTPPIESPIRESRIVRQTLSRCGFSLFSCPFRLHEYFKQSDVYLNVVSPDAVLEYFASRGKPFAWSRLQVSPKFMNDTEFKTIDSLLTLLKYCTGEENYKSQLEGLPFLVMEGLHCEIV